MWQVGIVVVLVFALCGLRTWSQRRRHGRSIVRRLPDMLFETNYQYVSYMRFGKLSLEEDETLDIRQWDEIESGTILCLIRYCRGTTEEEQLKTGFSVVMLINRAEAFEAQVWVMDHLSFKEMFAVCVRPEMGDMEEDELVINYSYDLQSPDLHIRGQVSRISADGREVDRYVMRNDWHTLSWTEASF